jgi:hypothetical protein
VFELSRVFGFRLVAGREMYRISSALVSNDFEGGSTLGSVVVKDFARKRDIISSASLSSFTEEYCF